MDLEENKKVVIITGAAGGIGRALAEKFFAEGCMLMLVDIDQSGLERTGGSLKHDQESGCQLLVGDLSNDNFLRQVVAETIRKWNRIDVLINNACWRTIETMRTISVSDWEKTMAVSLTAPAFLSKYVAETMEQRNVAGVIINISSIMSQKASGYSPAYVVCKGGLESLTYELAGLFGPAGIRVISVSPGNIETEAGQAYKDENGQSVFDELSREMNDHTPLQRSGTVAEIARVCYWLSTAAASFVTGTTIVADGGFSHNFNRYPIKKIQFPKEF
jgi:NAD(P)-dependent dehydrogenase (short-subunit alcohol dehydrogenase family)